MPHGYCLQWNTPLLTTFVIGNLLIALSYFSIPNSLFWFQRKREDLAFKWLFLLFATFITACGFTHLFKIWTFWHQDYWLEAGLDLFTGITSFATAIAVWKVLPLALKIPSPTQLLQDRARMDDLQRQASKSESQVEQLSLAISSITDYAILLLDENGIIMSWNDGASAIKGYDESEILGKHFSIFYTQEDVESGRPDKALADAVRDGKSIDTGMRIRKDGSTFLANVVITPVFKDGSLSGFSKVTKDITEMKRIENEIAGLKDFYETVLNNLNDGVIVGDSSGKLLYFNNVASINHPNILNGTIPADSYSEVLGLYLPDMKTPYPRNELPLYKATAGETTQALEIYLKRPDSNDCRWLEVSGAPITVPTKTDLNCGVIVIRDITTRKDYERRLETISENLNASNKELEAFAAAVAHDLQEPLRTMTGFLELLEKKERSLDQQSSRYIRIVVETANRMKSLIRDLLSYTKLDNQPKPLQPVSADKSLDIALLHLRQSIEESGAIIEREALPKLLIDNSQLSLLFQNLIGNAIKYRAEETPRIKIRSRFYGNTWVISVNDNGIGFDTRHANRIFSVFKRLHTGDSYPGTGIGLAVCRRIIQRHGGRIWADSRIGEGSTFHFSVPSTSDNAFPENHTNGG
jgi:PAS domain S-box-containing protein